jgi:hypothetical protein
MLHLRNGSGLSGILSKPTSKAGALRRSFFWPRDILPDTFIGPAPLDAPFSIPMSGRKGEAHG